MAGGGLATIPPSAPPPFDPTLWVTMLSESDTVKERDVPGGSAPRREQVGVGR